MNSKICRWLKAELAGWQLWEVVYTAICTLSIMLISFACGENWLGVASAVTGTLYTLLAGKGKTSCYFFGIFNSAAYGYIAYSCKLYGDAMLNWFCYLPMMFAGMIFWRRKLDAENCVEKRLLTVSGRIITAAVSFCGIAGYAFVLKKLGGGQPWVDSCTTVLSVVAMVLTVKRCAEQWLMWILVNGISVVMWLRVYLNGGNSVATLLWWLIMFITGVIFFIRWQRAANMEKKLN